MGHKASALRRLGKLDESLALYKAAWDLGRQVFENDSEDLLSLEGNMTHAVVSGQGIAEGNGLGEPAQLNKGCAE